MIELPDTGSQLRKDRDEQVNAIIRNSNAASEQLKNQVIKHDEQQQQQAYVQTQQAIS